MYPAVSITGAAILAESERFVIDSCKAMILVTAEILCILVCIGTETLCSCKVCLTDNLPTHQQINIFALSKVAKNSLFGYLECYRSTMLRLRG